MQDFLTSFLNLTGLAWWIEVRTENPSCTYYFGPFVHEQEALNEKSGFIADLEGEGAVCTLVRVQRCKQPVQLTVLHENLGEAFSRGIPLLSA